jgi:transmembrane sensor
MSDETSFQTASGEPDWEALARAMAGEGGPGTREALSRYLAEHPDRAALVAALADAASRLGEEERASVDVEGALASVMARRDATPVVPLRSREPARLWGATALRAAAAVVALIGATLYWALGTRAPDVPAERYATAAGAVRALRLADGTRVQLGPASTLVVASGYGRSAREMELRGEAYFEVVHDEARPFVVRTADAVVRDLGTAFSVRADSAEPTRVVVTAGVVALETPRGAPDTLRAGDRGRVAPGQRIIVERGAATDDDVAWTRGELVFSDAPVDEVAAAVRRWYGVRVEVADPVLAGRRITATFRASESPDGVLRVLAAAMGGEVRRRGGVAVIRRAGGR